uniref:Desmoglein-3-like n=1 Tax=Seriola dumerili TaxID=41447 RepID=A0A3B4V4R9_SERDU
AVTFVYCEVITTVVFLLQAVAVVRANSGDKLVRKKREWLPPPKILLENKDYTQEESVAKCHRLFVNIPALTEGKGDKSVPPLLFQLSGVAMFTDGRQAERHIAIRFKVGDENDNSPVFGAIQQGKVNELSAAGTSVMKITATDADEPGHENSQIAYSIIDQNPPHDMFYIESDGTIYVKNILDRETADLYTLTVKGQDLNGKPGGNSETSTVTIKIQDVNDNLPTLEKDKYEASIEENTEGVEVMRLKAQDLDLEGTENWEAVFEILKGNEAGYFSIRTDPVTNEGILMLDKDVKDLELGLSVRNKAELFGSGAISSWQSGTTFKTYPIKINVKNQPEGPRFDPETKAIPISEGSHTINIKDVIARYPAIDGDTGKPAENVRYVKGSDPDNWLTIDPETAEIKLNKMPDRESPYIVNGSYSAQVLCISEDMPGKTSTGTIAIQVEDFNDHCPTLTSDFQTMCTTSDNVIVNAKDEDGFPNGPPFDFDIVPEGTKGKWQVEHLNDTAAILRAQESMWPGFYEVEFLVKDEQGHVCPEPQKVTVQVCTCEDGVVCGKRGANGQPSKGAELGPAGIGLLFLGLLLLALIPLLLLFCQCGGAAGLPGGFTEMPFDTKSHLINYRTEGQGENTVRPTYLNFEHMTSTGEDWNTGYTRWSIGVNQRSGSGFYSEFEGRESGGGGGIYDGMALSDHFLGQYYSQVRNNFYPLFSVTYFLLIHDYEGQGSSAGSVGCCSLLESDNDLQFLNDLGPKFKTLAEVCGGKTIQTEVKPVFSPPPSTTINTPTSVSSLITAPQLPPSHKLQPTVSKTEQTMVRETSEHSQVVKESMTPMRGGKANQGQMLLLQQQPVYYTSTPVLQPMQYVVQPQVQNTMLLAEAPPTNLQGMVLVNGTHTGPAQGVVVQGQTVMSSGQSQGPNMVLVERSGIHGDSTNLIHTGSQPMMVMEGKVPVGSMNLLKGSQTCLVQGGTLQQGGLSGSQRVLVVGAPASSGGQLVQEAQGLSKMSDISGSQRILYRTGSTSTGLQGSVVGSSTTTVSTTPTYHKVVQETREIH